ncbi:MAG: sugar ABC transporter ATP-binding protein, partial [Actinobacteria bacterium]|nr:sugar ABC transporter ATP-binding protein [Actinomycetota bacterium]
AGFGVIFVTHRLDEVLALTSRVSVLRDGNLVADRATEEFDERSLIESILGFQLDELYPEAAGQASHETVFSARDVRSREVGPVSFDAGRGEVLGLTGLLGMGWEQILYMLFGADEQATGSIEVDGESHDLFGLDPVQAVEAGMALLPADRQQNSGVGEASVQENLTLTTLRKYFRGGALRLRSEARDAAAMLEEFDVRPPDPKRRLATLSGGNQQKVLLAKWFAGEPSIFLMHEPTQGVDIGAKKQIFGRIRSAAESGVSVIIASAEYEDLVHICDRIIVFRDGLASAELRAEGLTQERLIDQCFREPEAAGSA